MELDEISALRKRSLSKLAGGLYPTLMNSKKAAINYANDVSSDLRQACLSILIFDFEIDNETVDCLLSRTEDANPIVRSTARLGLVRHFHNAGLEGWELPLTEVILDQQVDVSGRLAAYGDLLRLTINPPASFKKFCLRLESATLSDVDWRFVNEVHDKSKKTIKGERSKGTGVNGTVESQVMY